MGQTWASFQNSGSGRVIKVGPTSGVVNWALRSHTTLFLGRWTYGLPLDHLEGVGALPSSWTCLRSFYWLLSFLWWFRNFTMESRHTHVLPCKNSIMCPEQKEKNSTNVGNSLLFYPVNIFPSGVQLCLKLAMLLVWKLKEGCVSDCKVWSKSQTIFPGVLGIRVETEGRRNSFRVISEELDNLLKLSSTLTTLNHVFLWNYTWFCIGRIFKVTFDKMNCT